jgi:hypothetical protein
MHLRMKEAGLGINGPRIYFLKMPILFLYMAKMV